MIVITDYIAINQLQSICIHIIYENYEPYTVTIEALRHCHVPWDCIARAQSVWPYSHSKYNKVAYVCLLTICMA